VAWSLRLAAFLIFFQAKIRWLIFIPRADLGSSLAKLKAKVPHGFSVAFS